MNNRLDDLTLDMLLLDYATGALTQAESLLMASYMALNPQARRTIGAYEALGGGIIERLDPVAVSNACFERTLAMLDQMESRPRPALSAAARPARPSSPDEELARLPAALLACMQGRLEQQQLAWARLIEGIEHLSLLQQAERQRRQQLDLLRLRPGIGTQHGVRGRVDVEITLVIQGAYEDAHGVHTRGHLAIFTKPEEYQASREQGCITLTLTSREMSLEERLLGLLSDFLR